MLDPVLNIHAPKPLGVTIPEVWQIAVDRKATSGFPVDTEIVDDFINAHDVSCHTKHFPKIIILRISMENCAFLQDRNAKQLQSSDEIPLTLCRKRSGQLYVRHGGGKRLYLSLLHSLNIKSLFFFCSLHGNRLP